MRSPGLSARLLAVRRVADAARQVFGKVGSDPPFFMGPRGPGTEVRVVQDGEAEFRRLAEPILVGEGLELVDLALKGSPGRQVLRLDIDRPGSRGVDRTGCQRISRALEEILDETEPLRGRYLLEVSSPGIDRPIRSADDIRRNTGRRVLILARDADGTSREHRGTLLGREDGQLRLQEAEGKDEVRIPLEGVLAARQDVEF